MKAVLQSAFGNSETLYIGTTEQPTPKTNELLIRVKATALNRADIHQREGNYPAPSGESTILGLECAGVVEYSSSSKFKIGDEVLGLVPGGSYAEKVCLHEDMAMKKPTHLSFEEAAAIPEAFLTAWQSLIWLGGLQKDQRVLIHAGASGVGNAAIQLAKVIGAHVFTTCSTHKVDFCKEYGADFVIDYSAQDFAEVISQITTAKGVHVIIDFIGGDYVNKNILALSKDGKIIQLATLGAGTAQIDLRKLMAKRGQLIASTLRSRDRNYQINLTKDMWSFAASYFENGSLKPCIDSIWSWNDVAKAHDFMSANKNKGKIVLKVD